MLRAEWTLTAQADLKAIYRYIAYDVQRPNVAKDISRELRDGCDHYANLTASGHLVGVDRTELGPTVRSFTHKRWVVLFRPRDPTIEILAVFDGSQQYEKLFKSHVD